MYTIVPDAAPNEAKVRAAAEQAGIVGVVVLRPVHIEKELSSRPATYAGPDRILGRLLRRWRDSYGHDHHDRDARVLVTQNSLVWGGQSKTKNTANLNRLIADAAKQVADELERQGLMTKKSHENDTPTQGTQ